MEIRKSSKPDEVWVCCIQPECGDTRFRLGINLRTRIGHCFNCGWRSPDAVTEVLELGEDIPLEESKPQGPVRLPEGYARLTPDDFDEEAYQYLVDRDVNEFQIRRFKVGYSLTGRYAGRVIFPCYDRKGKLEYFVARDYTGEGDPRYLNSVGKKGLFGIPKKREKTCLYLAEGIFKALRLQRHLHVEAAALLGHTISKELVERIIKKGYTRVLIWPDPDPPGCEGVIKVAETCLEAGLVVFTIWPLPKNPADEQKPKFMRRSRQNIVKFNWLTKQAFQIEATKMEE